MKSGDRVSYVGDTWQSLLTDKIGTIVKDVTSSLVQVKFDKDPDGFPFRTCYKHSLVLVDPDEYRVNGQDPHIIGYENALKAATALAKQNPGITVPITKIIPVATVKATVNVEVKLHDA